MADEITEVETTEEEIVIPQETTDEIVKTVVSQFDTILEKKLDAILAAKTPVEAPENVVVKTVTEPAGSVSFGTTTVIDGYEKAPKEKRLAKQYRALASGDNNTLKHMNDFNLEKIAEAEENLDEITASRNITGRYISKATYNNETTNSEGKYLIPDPEFLIAIERYEAQYGVAFANCTVRTTDRIQVKANKGATNVELYELDEAAQKTQTKPTFDQVSATMRKFAGIVVASDEFLEDEAAGFWNDVTQGLARARAKQADTICFTEDSLPSPDKKGILNYPGIIVNGVGSAITSISWDELLDTESTVLPEAKIGAKWVMHRTVWNELVKKKGTTNDHYFYLPNPNNSATPWGTPIVQSELFRSVTAGENNQPYALYGDLSKIQLWVRGGLTLTYDSSGTVGSLNLFEKDLTALRAVTRMTKLITFPERFTALGTGTVS